MPLLSGTELLVLGKTRVDSDLLQTSGVGTVLTNNWRGARDAWRIPRAFLYTYGQTAYHIPWHSEGSFLPDGGRTPND